MKVLAVAPQPFFSWRGTPFSVYYRSLVSGELGHEVDILTYGEGMDVDLPGCRVIRIPSMRWLGSVKTGPSALKLFLDMFMVVWTAGLLLRHRYDVVHAHEEAVFWVRWLKPIFGFRLIYDMHSSLPQQLHNFEFTDLKVLHWLFECLEKSAVKAADAVIAICPSLYEYARSITDDQDKVMLIENSLFEAVRVRGAVHDEGHEAPSTANGCAVSLQKWLDAHPWDQLIAYAGTLEAYQGLDKLIEAFAQVSRQLPDAGLLIIGGQPEQVAACARLADSHGIGRRVYLTGQLPQSEAQRLVAMAGACVSPRFSGNNTPLKIYQLMASGVPMIATRIESHTQVLDDQVATLTGVTIPELADGMLQVLREPETARAKAANAQHRYERDYSRDVYTAKMQALFARVG